jgi:dipeptidyl-peptidase-4
MLSFAMRISSLSLAAALTAALALTLATPAAQDRLRAMPGYDQFTRMNKELQGGSFVSGAVTVRWEDTSRGFTYTSAGQSYRFDVATLTATAAAGATPAPDAAAGRAAGAGRAGGQGRGQGAPPPVAGRGRSGGLEQAQTEMTVGPVAGCPNPSAARGRQIDCSVSPDGKLKAFYRDRNFWVANFDGSGEKQITTDGSLAKRIKNGSGSWVYGEELGQTTAIWWSPDSTKVGYYRFDESPVKDFYLQMTQTSVQSTMDVEAYPKAGAPNPIAEVFVYDVVKGARTKIDVRDGKPFTDIPPDGSKFVNDVVGHYAYNVRWSADGSELLLNRTNRRQNIMELAGCSPASGECRVIVREEWLPSWTNNRPQQTPLADRKRFIWQSERNGFANYYLGDMSGRALTPITSHKTFEVGPIIKIDEAAGVLFYMARSGDNFMKMQLHRVGLDGRGDVRLTDPKFNHSIGTCQAPGGGAGRGGGAAGPGGANACGISPDNKFFVDVYQTHDQPPATQLVDMSGKAVAQVAKSDMTKYEKLGLKKAEMFTYLAADGKTTLYGTISFPSNFDPSKKYPALASVYGGPGSAVTSENFMGPNATTEYGFLMLQLSSRSAPGRGKAILDQSYMKLGITEMADMAEGVKALWARPYFDKGRVGIYGTSYGGYSAALSLLKYPDVWTAASASSSVTSWYHYDSIYTERYMWIPQENKEGYEEGNAMNFAKNLRGRLLIYYGTADNNVHPNNSMQLIRALQQAGKSFEVQVGPDQGHTGVNTQRMMEFFIENLVQRPDRLIAPSGGN